MTRLAAAAAVLALALAPVRPAAQAPPSSALSEARRLINAGDPKGALAQLDALPPPADDLSSARIAHLRGVAYYHAGDPVKAIDALTPIVDRLPPESIERREADQVLGLSLFLAGRFGDALPRLEATKRWAPDNLELTYALAQTYIRTQRALDARTAMAAAFRVPADSAAAHLLLAQLLVRLELDGEAETELAAALDKDARLPGANQLRGQIALFRGRLDEAITFTARELALNPANAMALSQLGDAYVRQSNWDAAIEALQKSIWLNPYYSAPYILMGRAYMKKDQPATAEGLLRRAIQYDPNNRSAHYLLAQVLQGLGRHDEAKREFAIAERLTPPRGQ